MFSWNDLLAYKENAPLIFSQYLFLFIFTVFFLIYTFIYKNITVRNLYLLFFSLFFYYKSGGFYFWILIFSTVVDFNLANWVYRAKTYSRKKIFFILSIGMNLALLGFFKYSYFFVDLINQSFHTQLKAYNFLSGLSNMIAGTNYDVSEIILPVGISFYTFQAMSYTFDIYRGNLHPVKNIWDFGFFISFFPHLVAGPIVKAADFIPQVYKPYHVTRAEMGAAIFMIVKGLIKKVLISDYISINFVDRVFDAPQLYSGFENLMAVYGYALQIYCDFSGYSEMAIGLALLMGFRLGINFNSPYTSLNITEFWRRWHISLSGWLRDYLYISFGGNRRGRIRTYVNLFLTMLLGGLWHGASVKFILWGGLHGIALVIHKLWKKMSGSFVQVPKSLAIFLSWFITFHFVSFCWIYFRAPDMETVYSIAGQIAGHFTVGDLWVKVMAYKAVMSLIVLGFGIHLLPAVWKKQWELYFIQLPDILKALVVAVVIFMLYQIASSDVQPFIYFQF